MQPFYPSLIEVFFALHSVVICFFFSDQLYLEIGQDLERCQRGLVYLDETDKIRKSGGNVSISRDGKSLFALLLWMGYIFLTLINV